MNINEFENRKRDHIQYALAPSNQACGLNGLDQVNLIHDALPDLSFKQVCLDSKFLGIEFKTPFFVAGMTAGHQDAVTLNQRLAKACSAKGWVFGVGSQRRQIEDASYLDIWKDLRERNPDLTMLANIGSSQLPGLNHQKLSELAQSIGASALVVHLNPLQEALQPEGTPNFLGVLKALEALVQNFEIPVVLKETGCGFSKATLLKIKKLNLKAIDISGLGGTHWGRVEGARAFSQDPNSYFAKASETFKNWGVSTVDSVLNASEILKNTEIWASGGVRSGLDAAKLIALGATRVGYAKPALEQALLGETELLKWMDLQEFELRVALFCTDSKNPKELKMRKDIWTK